MAEGVALAIMCKVPVSGKSKTRLCPPLSADQAAALSACFIADVANTVAAAAEATGSRAYAMVTPAEARDEFAGLLPEGVSILAQHGFDLSARLAHAVRELLAAGHAGVCLINADGPTLPEALVVRAASFLQEPGERLALVPAIDGGYALIGLTRDEPSLFAGIAWSTSRVLAQTLARAAGACLTTRILPPWYDVDDVSGLELLCHELFGPGRFPLAEGGLQGGAAPRSRAALADLLSKGLSGPLPAETAAEKRRRPPTSE